MKRVSVIIPCYNTAPYLERCVASVLAQTVHDIEVILADDGSSDDTPAICDAIAARDDRVKVLHMNNAGPATAKNRGLEVATGEFVSFIDSDDELEPMMYERMLQLASTQRADIVCCGYRQVDEQGRRSHEEHSGITVAFGREEGLRRLLDKDKIYSQGWTKLFRRELLVRASVRFIEGLRTEEDFLFNLDAFIASCRIALDDTPYYIYTHREGSLSRQYHVSHTARFAGNMTMRLQRTEALLRHSHPTLSVSLTLHCAAYSNLLLGRLAAGPLDDNTRQHWAWATNYMRRHALTVLRHHGRCGLSLGGALLLLLLPNGVYHTIRSKKK